MLQLENQMQKKDQLLGWDEKKALQKVLRWALFINTEQRLYEEDQFSLNT